VWSVAPATQNYGRDLHNVAPATKTFENDAKVLRLPHKPTFDTLPNMQVGMPQSAAPATQNDRTTCLETFKMLRLPRKLQLIL